MAKEHAEFPEEGGRAAWLGHGCAVLGFVYSRRWLPFNSRAEISIGIAAAGWLVRTIATSRTGFRHTKLDWPIGLFVLWTVASALLSAEPRVSSRSFNQSRCFCSSI